MRILLWVTLSVGLAGIAYAQSAGPSGDTELSYQNAAVKYLRADASLRQSYPLAPDAPSTLAKSPSGPLTKDEEKIASAAGEALTEFHHGSTLRKCDWAMSAGDGALANTAHRGAISELVAVAGIRARLRFRDGDVPSAVSDIVDSIAAARHLSVDGSLASVLIGYRLENNSTQILSGHLQRLSVPQLDELARDWNALPPGWDLGTAFAAEKNGRNEFSVIARDARNRDEILEAMLKDIPTLNSDRKEAAAIVDACGGTVDGFRRCVAEQKSFYEPWAGRFKLSPVEFEKVYVQEIDLMGKSNPLIRQFTPNLPRFRWTEAYQQTRRALLQAAIDVQRNGPASLHARPDPYDGKPFAYAATIGGFRLSSQLAENGTPLSLTVGQTP